MCEYQRIDHYSKSGLPICNYTKDLCTFCVYGNFDTYNEAQEAEKTLARYVRMETKVLPVTLNVKYTEEGK